MRYIFLKVPENLINRLPLKKEEGTLIADPASKRLSDYTAAIKSSSSHSASAPRTPHLKETVQGHRAAFRTPFAAITPRGARNSRERPSSLLSWRKPVKAGPRRPGDTTQTHLLVPISRRKSPTGGQRRRRHRRQPPAKLALLERGTKRWKCQSRDVYLSRAR